MKRSHSPENKGTLTLVDREHYNPTDISVAVAQESSHIQASGAQAVLVFTVGSPLGTFLKAAFQGGLAIPIFTTAANYNFKQLLRRTNRFRRRTSTWRSPRTPRRIASPRAGR